MVDKEVLGHFVISVQHLDNAQFAGSPRHAIAEGYSAVDACFSALLIDAGQIPPRNHKDRLNSVMKLLPHLLDDYREARPDGGSFWPGVAWKSIETFYRDWLAARYEEFSAGPKDARVRIGQAHTVVTFAMRYVGKRHDFPAFGLDDKITYASLRLCVLGDRNSDERPNRAAVRSGRAIWRVAWLAPGGEACRNVKLLFRGDNCR